jgi:hypothetical protein
MEGSASDGHASIKTISVDQIVAERVSDIGKEGPAAEGKLTGTDGRGSYSS